LPAGETSSAVVTLLMLQAVTLSVQRLERLEACADAAWRSRFLVVFKKSPLASL
jgi:hypothetical protein